LAQRSSAAAKEIKELINTSVSRVQTGTTLVGDAGRTMSGIIGAVQRVTDIMGEIAAASEEQSSGIEQVARAVTQMDEVTQQNAALVEEAAAAAQSLEGQATKLRQAVAVFHLDDDSSVQKGFGHVSARSGSSAPAKSRLAVPATIRAAGPAMASTKAPDAARPLAAAAAAAVFVDGLRRLQFRLSLFARFHWQPAACHTVSRKSGDRYLYPGRVPPIVERHRPANG
ncbi:MAG: methyl-accepting chemotaxis protein serine sensor receptor, partial [Caballeronia sp.]|nr:methyl-accepting chemotaxis protein serine sensor receptor [Caballeronia sp.]